MSAASPHGRVVQDFVVPEEFFAPNAMGRQKPVAKAARTADEPRQTLQGAFGLCDMRGQSGRIF